MPLITATEARAYLPQTASDTTLIEGFILTAEQMLAAECGYARPADGSPHTFAVSDYILYVDARGQSRINLPVGPIVSVASLYDDPDREWGTATLIASTDYDYHDSVIELSPRYGTASGSTRYPLRRALKVTCEAGYGSPDEALKDVCGWMVKHLFEQRRRGQAAGAEDNFAASPRIPASIRSRLGPYVLASAWAAE